jgi:hypothetical protein
VSTGAQAAVALWNAALPERPFGNSRTSFSPLFAVMAIVKNSDLERRWTSAFNCGPSGNPIIQYSSVTLTIVPSKATSCPHWGRPRCDASNLFDPENFRPEDQLGYVRRWQRLIAVLPDLSFSWIATFGKRAFAIISAAVRTSLDPLTPQLVRLLSSRLESSIGCAAAKVAKFSSVDRACGSDANPIEVGVVIKLEAIRMLSLQCCFIATNPQFGTEQGGLNDKAKLGPGLAPNDQNDSRRITFFLPRFSHASWRPLCHK